jgi:hypothetical protein
MQLLDCWDHGIESCQGHGCLSLVFIVCCIGSGHCDELITRSEESYRLWVSVCDLEASPMPWPGPKLGCCATEISNSK